MSDDGPDRTIPKYPATVDGLQVFHDVVNVLWNGQSADVTPGGSWTFALQPAALDQAAARLVALHGPSVMRLRATALLLQKVLDGLHDGPLAEAVQD